MKTTNWRPAYIPGFCPALCSECGREELQKTVAITNGQTARWVGVGCAARLCGSKPATVRREIKRLEDAEAEAKRKASADRTRAVEAWLGRSLYAAARELAGVPVGPTFRAAYDLLLASFDAAA